MHLANLPSSTIASRVWLFLKNIITFFSLISRVPAYIYTQYDGIIIALYTQTFILPSGHSHL